MANKPWHLFSTKAGNRWTFFGPSGEKRVYGGRSLRFPFGALRILTRVLQVESHRREGNLP